MRFLRGTQHKAPGEKEKGDSPHSLEKSGRSKSLERVLPPDGEKQNAWELEVVK